MNSNKLKLSQDELEFTLDETEFDLDETEFTLDNDKIINKRWKNTDKYIREAEPEIQKEYSDAIEEILEVVLLCGATAQNLNKKAPQALKKAVEKRIRKWKASGLLKGYFKYFVANLKNTYSSMLKVLLYGVYEETNDKVKKKCNKVYRKVAKDMLDTANKEGPKESQKKDDWLTWALIAVLLYEPTTNATFEEYMDSLTLTDVEETFKSILTALQQGREVNEQILIPILEKQRKRIVNTNGDKESGALVNISRSVGNKVYTKVHEDSEEKIQVKFIAEMDEKTTEMCQSLDGQLFYINDYNTFSRYSDQAKKNVVITCYGLQQGVNLPPIDDHFHWCRSTVIYWFDPENEKAVREGHLGNTTYMRMDDIRQDARENKYYSKTTKNGKVIVPSTIEIDGKNYEIDGKKIVFKTSDHEREIAEWYANEFNTDVTLRPEIYNPDNVKSADYIIDGENVDLKTPKGRSKTLIDNNINRKQATSYIFDISETPLSVEELETQISTIFNNGARNWLNKITLVKDMKLIGVYERK